MRKGDRAEKALPATPLHRDLGRERFIWSVTSDVYLQDLQLRFQIMGGV